MANRTQWALRVTLSYEGRAVTLQSAVQLEMIAPPSIHLDGAEKESGAWFVIEDKNGKPLHRRPIGNPFSISREVFGATNREFSRVKVPVTKGIIELLVPVIAGAETVALHASDTEGERAHHAAQRVIHFRMAELTSLAARQGAEYGRK